MAFLLVAFTWQQSCIVSQPSSCNAVQVTHRDTIGSINELTGAAVTTKGFYVPPGKAPPDGERKLHLLIEGPNEGTVKKAKAEIKRILAEMTEKAMRRDNQSLI